LLGVTSTSTLFSVLNTGFVGIGSSSPNTNLVVSGAGTPTIKVDSTTNGFASLSLGAGGTEVGSVFSKASTGEIFLQNTIGGNIRFQPNAGVTAVTINQIGNLGVGTTSPFANLSVQKIYGATTTILFSVSSSTNSTGAKGDSFFSIDSLGTSTLLGLASSTGLIVSNLNAASCDVKSDLQGHLSCGTDATGAGGAADPFIWTSNFGSLNAATTSILWAQSGLNASSTANLVDTNIYGKLGFISSSSDILARFNGQTFLQASTTANSGITTLGYQAGNALAATTSFAGNTVFGFQALLLATSSFQNTAVGYQALKSANDYANQGNTAVGYAALSNATIAGYNTAVGVSAGLAITSGGSNVLLGAGAGNGLTIGNNNIAIGNNVGLPSNTASQQLNIGGILYGSGVYNGALTTGAPVTNGNLGVGSTSPFAEFSIHAVNGSTNTTLFAVGSSTQTATTTLFSILNNGNVGIGTSSAFTQLAVLPGTTTAFRASASTLNASGQRVYVQGRYAYVTDLGTTNAFEIWDVSNSASPTRISSSTLNANGIGIVVQGKYAYLADNSTTNSFEIWDVSNPTAPARVSQQTLNNSGRAIAVEGRYAYLVDQNTANAFEVWDVSNPGAPVRVSSQTINATGQAISIQGQYAYIVGFGTTNAFEVWDISNPTSPFRVSQNTLNASGRSLYVQGRYAYLADAGVVNAFEIWDISNPSSLVQVASSSVNLNANNAESIYVQGRYAYITDFGATNASLETWDVSTPAAPQRISLNALTANGGTWVHAQGRYAYVMDQATTNGFEIWDLGGAYVSQFEAGGIETGTLSVRNLLQSMDGSFTGSLTVANSFNATGIASFIVPTSTNASATNVFNIGTMGSTSSLFSVLGSGRVGVGTTTPFAKFSIAANNKESSPMLFAISSSTQNGTTTIIAISNTGSTTFSGILNAVNGAFLGQATTTSLFSTSHLSLTAAFGQTGSTTITSAGFIGVGTSTPFANLSIHNLASSTQTVLFAIGSTTNGGGVLSTSTLFKIDNMGSSTLLGTASSSALVVSGLNAAACDVKADLQGRFSCGTDATGSASGGADFTYNLTNFGAAASATTTPLWFQAGFQASSTANLVDTNIYGKLGFVSTSSDILARFNGQTFLQATTTLNGVLTFGYQAGNALLSTTTSAGNTAFGSLALNIATSSVQNVAIGYQTLRNTSDFSNGAGGNAINSGSANVAVGYQALTSNTSGSYNSAIGSSALFSNTIGFGNNAQGISALQLNTTGNQNQAIGNNALRGNVSGTLNVAIGDSALRSSNGTGNIGLGFQAGSGISTGSYNLAIGYDIDVANPAGSQQLSIGNVLFGTGLYNGGATSSAPVTNGNIGLGTTTPFSQFAIHAVNGSTNTTLFAIGSSTQTATTTLFSIDNLGTTTLLTATTTLFYGAGLNTCNSGFVVTYDGKGKFGCAADATAAGAANPFNFTNNFAVITAATSSRTLFDHGLSASTTVDFGNAGVSAFHFDGTTGNLGLGTSTPYAKLSIQSNTTDTGSMALFSISSSTAGANPYMSVLSSGTVAIGGIGATSTTGFTQLTVLPGTSTVTRINSSSFSSVAIADAQIQGRYIYTVGSGASVNGFEVWNVANQVPQLMSRSTIGATSNSIAVQGQYAYILTSTGANGMEIWDISNPYGPVRVSRTATTNGTGGISVSGQYAYLAEGTAVNGFEIYDISNPYAPVRVSQSNLNAAGNNVKVVGNLAYVIDVGTTNAFEIWNIANPFVPYRTSQNTLSNNGNDIDVQGRYAYVIDFASTNNFEIWDVSNPTSTVRVSLTSLAAAASVADIDVQGRTAYILSQARNGLEMWDVSNVAQPVLVSQKSTLDNTGGQALVVQGRYAWLPDGGDTWEVWDLGGAYIQQLEVGGMEISQLTVKNDIYARNSVFNGAVNIGSSLLVNGPVSITTASSTASSSARIFTINTSSTSPSLLTVTGNGNLGLGSTTPWGKFSVVTATNGSELNPVAVFATTSNWSTGQMQVPLLYIGATTTGTMDFARVSIGTTTSFGPGGLRDQFTVAGRINSTWRYAGCEFGSSVHTAGGSVATRVANICGYFNFDGIADARVFPLNVASTSPFTTPWTRLEAGSVSVTAGDAAAVSTHQMTNASSSPVFESLVVVPSAPGANAATTTNFMVGLVGTSTQQSNIYSRQDYTGFYFQATSTNYWNAIARGNNSTTTVALTAYATSTPYHMRIEVTPAGATYIMDGQVVAVIATTSISMPLAASISAGSTGTRVNPGSFPNRIDFSYIKFWSDDPPGSVAVAGIDNQPAFAEESYDRVTGADLSIAEYSNSASKFFSGLLVSTATSSIGFETAQLSGSRYDPDLLGVISTSPSTVLGKEASSTIRVATVGRVPVIVSLENGTINKGDRITASSISGIGMKATRAGSVIGIAFDSFASTTATSTGVSAPVCDPYLNQQLTDAGVAVPPGTCLATVLVSLRAGSDISVGNIFQDVFKPITNMTEAIAELANEAFAKGAELTKFVVGQIVAKVAVIGDLFATHITAVVINADTVNAKTLCLDGVCITKNQLQQVLDGSSVHAAPTPVDSGTTGSSASTTNPNAPVVSVNGNNPATIEKGSVYNDLGATILGPTDADKNLSIMASVDGSDPRSLDQINLDTGTLGSHTIIYSATNSSGIGTATKIVNIVPVGSGSTASTTPPTTPSTPSDTSTGTSTTPTLPMPDSGTGTTTDNGGDAATSTTP
jgi:hypothetical protein